MSNGQLKSEFLRLTTLGCAEALIDILSPIHGDSALRKHDATTQNTMINERVHALSKQSSLMHSIVSSLGLPVSRLVRRYSAL